MVKVLADISGEIKEQIGKCLSSSNVCGKDLREAHYYLGKQLGLQIQSDKNLKSTNVGVLVMMRAGLPFGLGLADGLELSNNVDLLFSSSSDSDFTKYDYVIIADAVINTGKTIFETIKRVDVAKVIVATNVISEKYLGNFDNLDTYSVRVSANSFKGSNVKSVSNGRGPDTGDRLFSSSFYNYKFS